MTHLLRAGVMLGAIACSHEPPRPVQLAAFPTDLSALSAQCDAETVPELQILCNQEVAIREAAAGHTLEAGERCNRGTDAMWSAECHFLVAETLAEAGKLDEALGSCLQAPTFLVSCIEHVAMLQTVPHRPGTTTSDIRRFVDQTDAITDRRLANLPAQLQQPLRDWLRLGRLQAWVLGQGPPPAGLGDGRHPTATLERTVRALEVARGMRAGAPYNTVRAAYNGEGPWPAATEPLVGCIPVAEPVDAALGPRTPVWGNTWRRVGRTADEDAEIALLVAMFWAGTTDIEHLQAAVRRDPRPAVAWTALHLARHLVADADDNDLRDLLADASRHPDPGIRAYASRPLPAVRPLPRKCVGRVPGRGATP
jgi:hypothetical protein